MSGRAGTTRWTVRPPVVFDAIDAGMAQVAVAVLLWQSGNELAWNRAWPLLIGSCGSVNLLFGAYDVIRRIAGRLR